MKHLEEVNNLLYRIGWPGLLSVPESGIGDEDLVRGIGKDKFIIEFYPAHLIVWKHRPIEVRLLDIQEGKLLYGVLALKCPLLLANGHNFSLLVPCPSPLPAGKRVGVRGLTLILLSLDLFDLNPKLIQLLRIDSRRGIGH